MDPDQAVSLVTTSYYRGVSDEVAVMALNHALTVLQAAGWPEDGHSATTLYVFRRIAQVSESARAGFSALLPGLSGHAERTLRGVIGAPGDESFRNALDFTVQGPVDLNLLWAEFFVTGAREPVLRIVSVLDTEDRIRTYLLRWLQSEDAPLGRSRRESAETLSSVGIELDLEAKRVTTEGDLDCFCISLVRKRGVPIFKLLPFSLEHDDLLAVLVKGAALWSLCLNARDHELVRAICEHERKRLGGSARLRLTESPGAEQPFSFWGGAK